MKLKTHILLIAILIFIKSTCSPVATATELPRIVFSVPDTAVTAGSNGFLNIYIDNFVDTIAGFQFVLQSTRPDLVTFDFSNGGYDTSGTLTSGFELVVVHDSLPDHSVVKFQCIADLPFDPVITPGFYPQQGGVVVKLPFQTTSLPDTSLSLVSIMKLLTPFDFSDPHGNSIGTAVDSNFDTTYFICNLWENDTCASWDSSSSEILPYDSIRVDTIHFGYLDSTLVVKKEGSITIVPPVLNCDINLSGAWEITDLTCLVDYMFGAADPQTCPNPWCDADRSGQMDIGDLTHFVSFLFSGGPPPE
ncbi:MAG: hypothetical protein P1R58_06520 [bacterium]|nr:hypothetical protein [bacterium]